MKGLMLVAGLALMGGACTHKDGSKKLAEEPVRPPRSPLNEEDRLPPRVAALRAVNRAYARLGDAAYAAAALMRTEAVSLPKTEVEQLMEAARTSYRDARDAVDQTAYARARELAAAAQRTADAVVFLARADAPQAAAIAPPPAERGPSGKGGEALRTEEILERAQRELARQAQPKTVAVSMRVASARKLEKASEAALQGMNSARALNLAEGARALAQASMHVERAERTTLLMPPPAGAPGAPAEGTTH